MSRPLAPVHHSGLATFRTCEQQWMYEKVERLESTFLSEQLVLGTWVHAMTGADDLQSGHVAGTLVTYPDSLDLTDQPMALEIVEDDAGNRDLVGTRGRVRGLVCGELVIEAATHWWNREAPDHPGDFQQDYLDRYGLPMPEHLSNLLTRYRLRWEAEDYDHVEILAVEPKWQRVIPGTDTVLQGTADIVYRDTRFGLVIVRDRKTGYSYPSESKFVLDLMGSQLHLYAWGVAPLLEAAGIPAPTALEWDRIRTKVPATPQVTQMGNLSKSVSDYDLPTYLSWVDAGGDDLDYPGRKKDGSQAGRYELEESVVEALSTDEARSSFFMRRRFPANESVIRRHVLMAHRDAQTMTEIDKDSAARSIGKHCSWCSFLTLCRAQLYGEVSTTDYDPSNYNLRIQP